MASKRNQAGFFTIDALFGLMVLAIMLSLAGWWMFSFSNQQDYRIAAEHQRTVADAFAKYLKDNYSVVLTNAGPTTPVQVTVDMMQNTKYLPAGFSSTNGFGQTVVGLARRLNANQLEAIVITTGGQVIPELGIRTIAEHLGGPGGFISALKPGVIQGVRGGWEVALSNYGINPGQGHTASALFLMDGDLANDYLYRNAVPGHPEYNRMNTAIDMGGNDINNARAVTATSDITSKDGWFRSQNDTGWVNEKWGGGIYQSDADWVRVLNDKGLLSGGKIRGGTLQADGRVTVGEYLDIESTAVEGQACPKIGIQSKNNLGAPLTCQCLTPSCQSGVWTISWRQAVVWWRVIFSTALGMEVATCGQSANRQVVVAPRGIPDSTGFRRSLWEDVIHALYINAQRLISDFQCAHIGPHRCLLNYKN
ncbi:shufflon system plasmid conjugative transfer pilus tip adhesin PilV [Pseudomonas gorinensis]|uniref:shufflon system plasmid conjugative transfer pilus tip adhesin PilV n=1 Tax=Pseudomonas gorinensis TaxID=3240790 RepID=UPI003D645983